MSSYELPTNVNPADIRLSHTCTCGLSHRIAAFGAIRRAATIARDLDREAIRVEDEFLDASDVHREARQVRRAIRAAIRSPKA